MTTCGRKKIYLTEEEHLEARQIYNRRYYDKKTVELKVKRQEKRNLDRLANNQVLYYTDERLLKIIDKVGFERLLKLMI
jgi:hypothetical protein